MCPGRELNWRPCGSQVSTQSSAPHQPAWGVCIFLWHTSLRLVERMGTWESLFIYLFILTWEHFFIAFRERRREKKRKTSTQREKHRLVAHLRHLDWGSGIKPTTQACALTRNWTLNPSVMEPHQPEQNRYLSLSTLILSISFSRFIWVWEGCQPPKLSLTPFNMKCLTCGCSIVWRGQPGIGKWFSLWNKIALALKYKTGKSIVNTDTYLPKTSKLSLAIS